MKSFRSKSDYDEQEVRLKKLVNRNKRHIRKLRLTIQKMMDLLLQAARTVPPKEISHKTWIKLVRTRLLETTPEKPSFIWRKN